MIKKNPPPPNGNLTVTTTSSFKDTPMLNLGGRPKGTSLLDLSIKEDIVAIAKREITVQYNKALINSDNNCNCLTKGTYVSIFHKVKTKFNLDDNFEFLYNACMKHIYRGKPSSLCTHLDLPLKDVEERFVQIIFALEDIGCPVTVGETINLIQALINGTSAQKKRIAYQRKLFKPEEWMISALPLWEKFQEVIIIIS